MAHDLCLPVRRRLAGTRRAPAGAWLTVRLSVSRHGARACGGHPGRARQSLALTAAAGVIHGYVEAVRNTPFLVQLLLVYLGLPSLGLRLTPDQAALLAMVVNLGAYATEIVRAGIESVPRGQIEAGRALGLKRARSSASSCSMPALRTVFPALSSQFILVMLASSVVSVISAEELTAVADTIVARNFRSFEFYFVTITLIYLALSLAFQGMFAVIDRALFRRWSVHT